MTPVECRRSTAISSETTPLSKPKQRASSVPPTTSNPISGRAASDPLTESTVTGSLTRAYLTAKSSPSISPGIQRSHVRYLGYSRGSSPSRLRMLLRMTPVHGNHRSSVVWGIVRLSLTTLDGMCKEVDAKGRF
ncbi:hypothetical protein BDV28DRAFT_135100 [Aspergillus coremiiformis]|uniref:Uncharacterized protein n=1 Tax=Aspergillus coremiiformis TaxID=138285 RepID=A0A5N6Z452_9EURO|nr:hypothetical protein BDV28DRAFT_135100 [Aspergillus coremiiformis]